MQPVCCKYNRKEMAVKLKKYIKKKNKFSKFTMEDVRLVHSMKPYLPIERFIKLYGYFNYKISKGKNVKYFYHLMEMAVESKFAVTGIPCPTCQTWGVPKNKQN